MGAIDGEGGREEQCFLLDGPRIAAEIESEFIDAAEHPGHDIGLVFDDVACGFSARVGDLKSQARQQGSLHGRRTWLADSLCG